MFKALITRFFSTQYLFAAPFQLPSHTDHLIYYFGLALVVVGLVLLFIRRSRSADLSKNLLSRWSNLAFYIGLALVIWYLLRYELVALLSTHIVMVVIFVAGIVWLIFLLKYQCGNYRAAQAKLEQEKLKQKYM